MSGHRQWTQGSEGSHRVVSDWPLSRDTASLVRKYTSVGTALPVREPVVSAAHIPSESDTVVRRGTIVPAVTIAEADALVKHYSSRQRIDAAQAEVRTSALKSDRRGSPEAARHKLLSLTAAYQIGASIQSRSLDNASTNSTLGDRSHLSVKVATERPNSPRSWQDDVIRRVLGYDPRTETSSAVAGRDAVSVSVQEELGVDYPVDFFARTKESTRPNLVAPHTASISTHPFPNGDAPMKSLMDDDNHDEDDGFIDAETCVPRPQPYLLPTTLRVERADARDGDSSHAPCIVSPSADGDRCMVIDVDDVMVHEAGPSPLTNKELVPSHHAATTEAPLVLHHQHHAIVAEIAESARRISMARTRISTDALQFSEESCRRSLIASQSKGFESLLLFLDEALRRSAVHTRQQGLFYQLIEAFRAVHRREVVHQKLCNDWIACEVVERRRIVQQWDMWFATIQGPWRQLQRVWAPRAAMTTEECALRKSMERHEASTFFEMCMVHIEMEESLFRMRFLSTLNVVGGCDWAAAAACVATTRTGTSQWISFRLTKDHCNALREHDSELQKLQEADVKSLKSASGSLPVAPQQRPESAPSEPNDWTVYFASMVQSDDGRHPVPSSSASTRQGTPACNHQLRGACWCLEQVFQLRHRQSVLDGDGVQQAPLSYLVSLSISPQFWFGDASGTRWLQLIAASDPSMLALECQRWETSIMSVVAYFSLFRPVLRALHLEASHRIMLHQRRDDDVLHMRDWHRSVMADISLREAVRHVVGFYHSVSQRLETEESVSRAAWYGFFMAWKGRLQFLQELREMEDESWEHALQLARNRALLEAESATRVMQLYRQTTSPPVVSAASVKQNPLHAAFPSAHAVVHQLRSIPTVERLAARDAHALKIPSSGDALTSRGTSVLTHASSQREPHASAAIHRRDGESEKSQPHIAAVTDGGDAQQGLVDELFALADVAAEGYVKLPHAAAALRMRHVCFDLPLVATCFHRAAHLQREMYDDPSCEMPLNSTSSITVLHKSAFALMLQLIRNHQHQQHAVS